MLFFCVCGCLCCSCIHHYSFIIYMQYIMISWQPPHTLLLLYIYLNHSFLLAALCMCKWDGHCSYQIVIGRISRFEINHRQTWSHSPTLCIGQCGEPSHAGTSQIVGRQDWRKCQMARWESNAPNTLCMCVRCHRRGIDGLNPRLGGKYAKDRF